MPAEAADGETVFQIEPFGFCFIGGSDPVRACPLFAGWAGTLNSRLNQRGGNVGFVRI